MDRPRTAPASSDRFARGPEDNIHELTCYHRLSPPAGVTGETSRSIKPRVRALRSQLCFCPVFNEASEPPRHAAHAHFTKSNPFRPHENAALCGGVNIADGLGKARSKGKKKLARAVGYHRARGLRDQPVLRSEEAPTVMALGGFEQLTLNP